MTISINQVSTIRPVNSEVNFTPPRTAQLKTINKVAAVAGIILLVGLVSALTAGIGAVAGCVIAACVTSSSIISLSAAVGGGIGFSVMSYKCVGLVKNHLRRKQLALQANELVFPDKLRHPKELIPGNSVLVTKNSVETSQHRLELIDKAEQSIELCGNFVGGKVFRDVLEHIEQRMAVKPGLKVHIIGHKQLIEEEDKKILTRLCERFSDRFNFLEVGEHLEFSDKLVMLQLHWKLFAVDEKYFIMGGTGVQDQLCTYGHRPIKPKENENIIQQWTYKGCRDFDVVGEGEPLVKQMRYRFYQQYALWETLSDRKHPKVLKSHRYHNVNEGLPKSIYKAFDENNERISQVPIRLTVSGPDEQNNLCSEEYIDLINNTKEGDQITIGNLIFNPDEEVMGALKSATKRKVDLTVLTNGAYENSPKANRFWIWSQRSNYLPLSTPEWLSKLQMFNSPTQNMGVTKIFEYTVKNILYHAKAITAGDKCAIGSFNLSRRSQTDYEILLTMENPEVAKKIQERIENDTIPLRSHRVNLLKQKYYRDSLLVAIMRKVYEKTVGILFG